jgi:hypothetical protein
MAIGWSKGSYVPVADIRRQVGWKYRDGSTSFNDLFRALRRHKINSKFVEINSITDLFKKIDEQKLVAILFQTGRISWTNNPLSTMFGRHYKDSYGHYILIKGYSLDKKYFIVYDPTPSDWSSNSKRYGDGMSMIGRNRYYPTNELYAALKSNTVIEISH